MPAAVLALAVGYPYYGSNSMPELPLFGPFPRDEHDGRDDDLHDDGARPELRRRLRGAARPRLRRVLRDGRVHGGLVRVVAVREPERRLRRGRPRTRATTGFHFSIWLVLPMAGIATAIVGVLIGLPTLRLRGDYLAIVTLGFGEILPQIARNGDNLFGRASTSRTAPAASRRSTARASATGSHTHLAPAGAIPERSGTSTRVFFWTALVLVAAHDLLRAHGCATRGSGAPGSRSARTRPPPRRWACR